MAANGKPSSNWSKTWTFYEGDWHEGNIGISARARMQRGSAPRCSTARARSKA